MSADSNFISLKTLDLYVGKQCKVVYWDPPNGRDPRRGSAFYGVLVCYDGKFQTWSGGDDRDMKNRKVVNFNHDEVSRIVMEVHA